MRQINQWMILLAVASAWLLGVAHAGARTYQAYDGEARPKEQVMQLLIPSDVTLLAVDGRSTRQGRFLSPRSYSAVYLLPGEHRITVRYDALWDLEQGDDFEKVRSDPVEVALPTGKPGIYQLSLPEMKTLADAEELAEHFAPEIRVIQQFAPVPVATPEPQPVVGAEPIQSAGTAPQPPPALMPESVGMGGPSPVSPAASGFSALELLKLSWQRATPAEQDAFREWMQER